MIQTKKSSSSKSRSNSAYDGSDEDSRSQINNKRESKNKNYSRKNDRKKAGPFIRVDASFEEIDQILEDIDMYGDLEEDRDRRYNGMVQVRLKSRREAQEFTRELQADFYKRDNAWQRKQRKYRSQSSQFRPKNRDEESKSKRSNFEEPKLKA